MIHHIKSLYADGQGRSIRAIAHQLELSRNTVRKYLRLDEAEISRRQEDRSRSKCLDDYRDFIVYQLQTYPQLSAVKMQRKLQGYFDDLSVSGRTVRRYIEVLRKSVAVKQPRYYMPVLDMVPGIQCQVDPGELRGVLLGGREVTLNQRFHEYANHAGFRIHACEGYDPESKGKVEAGVKYVKNNALYGETFATWPALTAYLAEWLDSIANVRCHGTTGEAPQQRYDAGEWQRMLPYLTPALLNAADPITRKADKTGLIAWRSNKYSVPMAYQRCRVEVREQPGQLALYDLEQQREIARHGLCLEKGRVIRNTDHYRDRAQQVSDYEALISKHIGSDYGQRLCALLKATSPRIYKDQLAGARRIVRQHGPLSDTLLDHVLDRPRLTATGLRDYLAAYAGHGERLQRSETVPVTAAESTLRRYAGLATPGRLS